MKTYLFFPVFLGTLTLLSTAKADYDDFVCPEEFLCPEEIMPEVKQWIHILGHQNDNQAMIYDYKTHKIYGFVECGEKCDDSAIPLTEKTRIASTLPESDAANVKYKVGMNERFYNGITIYQTYRDYIQASLAKNKLPQAIQYLPFYESGYDPIAKSNSEKIARGVWQLEPPAASGLIMNATIDERQDVIKATDKAMDYFNDSYACIRGEACKYKPGPTNVEISPFVITSYIYGTRIKNAFKEFGLDYPKIQEEYDGPEFKDYSRKYYPQFLAVYYIGTHMEDFYETIPEAYSDFSTQTLKFTKPTKVVPFADHLSFNLNELIYLNQRYIRTIWKDAKSIPTNSTFNVPLVDDAAIFKKYGKVVDTNIVQRKDETFTRLEPRPIQLVIPEEPKKGLEMPLKAAPIVAPQPASKETIISKIGKFLFK